MCMNLIHGVMINIYTTLKYVWIMSEVGMCVRYRLFYEVGMCVRYRLFYEVGIMCKIQAIL